ncbi:MAG TPA: hypothetical protein VMP13_02770, partial [Acidimicrobiia bacterium]|nr:hypothetical protein [Acidimicrobiia bacterium]
TVNFTISGLEAGQWVEISTKSGTNPSEESGPYGNGSHSYTSNLQQAISHVTLCVFEEEPGQIIVEKEVTAGSDTSQSFEFTASYDGDGFSLADGESNNSGDLAPGNYAVSETVPAGWSLVSATCDNGDDPDAIDLGAGETVTCTFVNDEDEVLPEPGEIIVEKQVTAGSDTSVAFTFNTTGFTLADNTLADGESSSSGDLDAGNYAVSETVPAGWSLVSATCDNGDDPSSIDLGAGETVTCTFVNDELPEEVEVGEIIVQKVVLNGSATFAFTFDTVGFTLADNTLAHGQSSSSGEIAVGDGYAVSEQLPPGWTMVSAVCDDGSPVTNIDVAAGETVTCTFTNTIEDVVQASILVQVTGICVEDDGEGEGVITVSMSVDDGADVVIRNASGNVVGTLSSDGSITVPEGATYTWEATANEGFEFPEDADTSGSITIETCSDAETLPFTGIDLDLMAAYAAALMAGGLAMLLFSRRAEES